MSELASICTQSTIARTENERQNTLSHETNSSNEGIVYRKSTGAYFVDVNGETVACTISTKLRRDLIYPIAMESKEVHQRKVWRVEDIRTVDPVAIGDRVAFSDGAPDGEQRTGMITEVLPRKSSLRRSAQGRKPLEQVIVANLDQVVGVIAAAQPRPKWGMVDRYLASAESCDISALICLTKYDLVRGGRAEREIQEEVENYRAIGYDVIVTSAVDSDGLDQLRDALTERLSVLVGMSGVGKSTLLNALQPGLGLRVNEVNQQIDKGRHTTTHLEMFQLEFGGAIVDTPGIKVFGLWNTDPDDVVLLFPEMAAYAGRCRFGLSCTHEHEPGCAIRRAVEEGRISKRRYQSFLYIRDHPDSEKQ